MSIYDKASLVLIPSGTKTSKVYSQKPTNGDGDFTFSRSTAATRVNASGNIEKETQNLLLQSNTFDTTWAAVGINRTSGQSGYDGTNNAWKIESTNTGQSRLAQTISISGVNTISFYAKAGTANYIVPYIIGGGDPRAFFNLSTGIVGTTAYNIDASMEDVGGGWYRCSMTLERTSSSLWVFIGNTDNNFNSAIGDNIYIQDAQLEQGLVARDVITTTTTAIYGGITDNVPRLDYTDSSCPALLLEPQRTNEVSNSEYFAGYNLNDCSVTSNGATSPEGVDNATKLFDGTGSGGHYISGMANAYFSNTEIRNTSVFAKAGTLDHIQIRLVNRTGSFSYYLVDVDLTDGSVIHTAAGGTTNTSNEVEDYGNGWYRITLKCSFTNTNVLSSGTQVFTHNGTTHSYVGTGTDYILIYGVQHEAGSYATSYIPTYGSQVTRAYENQDATGLSTSVFNNDDLTLFYDFDYNADGREGSTTAYRIFSGSSQLGIKGRSGSSRSVEIYSSGSFSGSIVFNNIANSSRIKVALRITNGTCELFFNGAKDTETIDVSGAAPYTWGQITMLASSSINTSLNQCLGFPTALTDQELIDLTTL